MLQEVENRPYIPNMNHVVRTLRQVVLACKHSTVKTSVVEFCKNNFVFKFLEFLDFEEVLLFVLDLLGVTNNCILADYQLKFWKYLQTTGFFGDLSTIMLTQEFAPTVLKFDNNFMMTDIKVDLRNEPACAAMQSLHVLQNDVASQFKIQSAFHLLPPILEDFDKNAQDIDAIKQTNADQIRRQFTTKDSYDIHQVQTSYFNNAACTRRSAPSSPGSRTSTAASRPCSASSS